MKKLSTRLILTCAAIGVAGAIVSLPSIYASLGLLGFAPPFYGFIVGIHIFPGVISQALIRRPGVALLTALLTGIACVPTPMGAGAIGAYLAVGVLQEVPFALTLYRYWRPWVFYAAAVIAGLITGAVVFVGLAAERSPLWVQIVQPSAFILSLVAATAIGLLVAKRLEKAGVARGISLPVDRRKSRAAAA